MNMYIINTFILDPNESARYKIYMKSSSVLKKNMRESECYFTEFSYLAWIYVLGIMNS